MRVPPRLVVDFLDSPRKTISSATQVAKAVALARVEIPILVVCFFFLGVDKRADVFIHHSIHSKKMLSSAPFAPPEKRRKFSNRHS